MEQYNIKQTQMKSQSAAQFFERLTREGKYSTPLVPTRPRAAAAMSRRSVSPVAAKVQGSFDVDDVVRCIISAYANSGLKEPGAGLRSKITRATTIYSKTGQKPLNLMTASQLLGNPAACLKGHVEGVTFFSTVAAAKNSPLYLKSLEVFGKKATPLAFEESRIRVGQSRDSHRLRTADSRVSRFPSAQGKERMTLMGRQSDEFAKMMAKQQASRPRTQQAPRAQQARDYIDI